jgi:acyl-CoA reductase-like NAD-dependent aldehyde dehydrogenase
MTNAPRAYLSDFVDGKPAAIDASALGLDLVAPQTGRSIGTIAESGTSGVDRAVAAASAAFAANRKQPTHQRIAWLNAAAGAIKKAADVLADLICEDVGKPIRMARFEVRRGTEFLELTAAALTQLSGETGSITIRSAG